MIKWKNNEELQQWISECNSYADFCRKLEINAYGANYKKVKQIIAENNLDISHFNKGPWNKNKKIKTSMVQFLPINQVLIENSPQTNTSKLKNRLWNLNLKKKMCEVCGYTENLELHHINGQPTDNRLENLQILCPNCHAKTTNYRGKNISYRNHKAASEWFITDEEANERHENKLVKRRIPETERKNKKIVNVNCPVCGKEFKPIKGSKYCSIECYHLKVKSECTRPDILQLIKDFLELKSFVQIGKKYNVSDNSVRKWFLHYNFPTKPTKLKKYLFDLKNILS